MTVRAVIGIGVDLPKVEVLAHGRAPYFEPGIAGSLQRPLESGRLRFRSGASAAAGSGLHVV